MKLKNPFLIPLLFLVFLSFSQQKGDFAISVTASPFPTQDSYSNDFGLIGKVGLEFFLSNKVSFSGSFFTSNNTVINNDSGITINSYGFIPSVQYYFLDKPKINVFGQLGYGFGFDDLTRESGSIENSALTIFSFGAGLNYKLNEKLFLQLTLPYFKAKNITINENAADGIAIFLGFNFKL
ncbi:MAG: porin family protein [Flavobacteriaceae bacterium]|nr:porin family protein [Flavobacteriaceae bacterium]